VQIALFSTCVQPAWQVLFLPHELRYGERQCLSKVVAAAMMDAKVAALRCAALQQYIDELKHYTMDVAELQGRHVAIQQPPTTIQSAGTPALRSA